MFHYLYHLHFQPVEDVNDGFDSLREEYKLTRYIQENQAGQEDQKRERGSYRKRELIYDCLFEGNSCFK